MSVVKIRKPNRILMPVGKHRVVIVGGGFGGIKTALELAHDNRFHVTLVSERTDFQVYSTLFRTITGGSHKVAAIPIDEIFHGMRINVLQDRVVSVDKQSRLITTAVGHTIPYEALVLSLGMQADYFGIKGLKKYAYGMKSLAEAEKLKLHLHRQLVDDKRSDLNYVIVGGGPSGIELAGALPLYLRKITYQHGLEKKKIHVDLVEAAPRLLPRMPKDMSRSVKKRLRKLGVKLYLNSRVQGQTVDSLEVNGKPIRSHTVIWTAGMTNNSFFTENNFQLASNKKARVDDYLQAEPGIYVIGDNADTAYSGMAQTAIHDGKFVANNLIRLANGKNPKPYSPKRPIYVIPAGDRWAAVLWGGFRIYGLFGWILRRAADWLAFHDFVPWTIATSHWLADMDQEEFCPYCVDDTARVAELS